MRGHLWVAWRALALSAALSLGVGCAMGDDVGSVAAPDTSITIDGLVNDVGVADTGAPPRDSSATADTGPGATDGDGDDIDATVVTVKSDESFIVPAGVAERRHLALGAGLAAWVERDSPGGAARLAVWDPRELDLPPRLYSPPHLTSPRELRVGRGHLVFVDDRYGDADIFALDLTTGLERAVVTAHGDQREPTVRGTVVAWADCRACVTGDDGAARDIWRLDLADAAPADNLTDDGRPDRGPVFGTLADGGAALAWIAGDRILRVVGGVAAETDEALDVGVDLAGVALQQGLLAWRARPLILNPDSMYPSDVYVTSVADGGTAPLSSRAERLGLIDPVPRGAAGRFAWLETRPSAPGESVLRVVPAGAPGAASSTEVARVVEGFDLGERFAGFVAPRADNGDLPDVWLFPVP